MNNDAKTSTYNKSDDWGPRDAIPTSDPIGDIVEEKSRYVGGFLIPESFTIGEIHFYNYVKNNKNCCKNPQKYRNVISNSLKFWSCSNCGADLGDI